MKVLYHHPAGARLRRRFAELTEDGITLTVVEEARGPALDAALAEAEVLWHCLYPIDAAFLEKAPKLRLIQKIGVGVNTIDRETAAARSITVCNLPGSNAPAVAEHTLALMLATLRQLPQLDAAMRRGQGWTLTPQLEDGLGELSGRRVGLVGWGDALGRGLVVYAGWPFSSPFHHRRAVVSSIITHVRCCKTPFPFAARHVAVHSCGGE